MNKLGHSRFAELTQEELDLHEAKNKDYRSASDPLANFKRTAAFMALYPSMNWATPEGVAIIYMCKQLDAGVSLLERGIEGEVETISKRFMDVGVYAKLIRILHEESKV